MKNRKITIVVLLAMVLANALVILIPIQSAKAYTSHSPILISSNAEFTSTNGVVSGSGTQANPYIIENWDINASSAIGIQIRNTNVYFVIRNCIVHDGKDNNKYGIYFYNVTNCKIDSITSYNNYYYGIMLYYSSYNNQITNCYVYNNDNGILLYYSSNNNQITNCTVYNNSGCGIYLDCASNNKIYYCNIYGNSNYGVYNHNLASEYQVNATYNWWGSTKGPGMDGANPVSSNVIFDPWLTALAGMNQPPTAYIDSISPNPAIAGQAVSFVGYGTDLDGTIVAYNWRSSADGQWQLSTSASFSASTLSVGTYTIYFKVQDDDGAWSNEVYQTLIINPYTQPTLIVMVNATPITINSDETSTITVTVKNGTNPVSGATINLQSNNGGVFSVVTDNGDGTYTATFTAPTVTTQTVCRITTTASKTGYNSGSGYKDVIVNPNLKPMVTITYPTDGKKVDGTITISGTASCLEGNIIAVYVKIDTGSWLLATGTTSWLIIWDTTTVSEGTYTIQAKSYNGLNYSDIDSVTVHVQPIWTGGGGVFIPTDWWLAVGVMIGIVLIGRRGKR